MKAKSRLQLRHINRLSAPHQGEKELQTSKSNIIIKYVRQMPTLLISLPFYVVIYYIFIKIRPDTISHFIIPNTYLPLQIPLFIANFFCLSFIFLNSRRGFLGSLIIALTLFLKLQGVLTISVFIFYFLSIFIFESIATVIDRK